MKEVYYLVGCYIKVYWFKLFGRPSKNKIPKGVYCYTCRGGRYNVCPYWVYGSYDRMIAGCKYLGYVDKGFCLWDQVKKCGVNDN